MPDIDGRLVGFVVTILAAVVVVVILVDSVELVDLVVVATGASVEVELVTLGEQLVCLSGLSAYTKYNVSAEVSIDS